MRLVVIEWVDSALPKPEWVEANDYKPASPTSVYSVGFIVHGDPTGEVPSETVSLAPNVSDFGEENCKASGVFTIPHSSIVAITDLTRTEPKSDAPTEEEQDKDTA